MKQGDRAVSYSGLDHLSGYPELPSVDSVKKDLYLVVKRETIGEIIGRMVRTYRK
jgi:hypothetical protein